MDPYTQPGRRDSLLSFGKQLLTLISGIVFYMIGFSIFAWAIWGAVNLATKIHWFAGLSVVLGLFLLLLWGLRWIRGAPLTALNFGQYPRMGLALNLILIAVLSMLLMALISNILYQQNILQYTSAQPITIDSIFAYYGWHLIDAIPVFDVWSVFDYKAPLEGQGFWAGLLLQAFLVLVIAASIETFQSKQADTRWLLGFARVLQTEEDTPYKRKTALEMAQRSLDQALTLAKRQDSLTDQIDIHLEYARLLIETGKTHVARAALEKADELIERETRRGDLERRRRAAEELQGRLEAGEKRSQAGQTE